MDGRDDAVWRAIMAGGDPIGPDWPAMPCVEPGQQVIDRRSGDTFAAIAWRPNLTLEARRIEPCVPPRRNIVHLPWRDVVPAGRARKGRG